MKEVEVKLTKEEILKKFSDPKDQQNLVVKTGTSYNKLSKIISEALSDVDKTLKKETFEVIRNFSIVAGAFAAFTIPLLAIHQSIFFALGVSFHILAVMISVAFLLATIDIGSKKLIKNREDLLDPVRGKSTKSLDVLKNRLSFEDWLSDELEKDFTSIHDEMSDRLQEISQEKRGLNYTPDVAFGVFVLANALILYGILDWTIVPSISDSLVKFFI